MTQIDSTSSPERDTPTTPEVIARSLSELQDLLTCPCTEGEPLRVRLDGPVAAQVLGVAVADPVAATGGEAVAR